MIRFTPEDFSEIISHCAPGPNKDTVKASRLRRFVAQDRFIDPATSPTQKRGLTITMALVCDDCVWVVMDFSRLIRFHVTSRSHMWTQDDFKVDSETWPKIWQYYGEGPDWNIERPLCMAALDAWRARILAKPTQGKAAIVNELSNNNNVFNGFGRHLANDFCFELAIFPGMPANELCHDDSLFGDLCACIGPYMDQWASAEYLTRCSIEPNTNNPLSFNTWSNEVYYSMYIKVFRKSCNARILPALYNKYAERGLLDPKHTIGTLAGRLVCFSDNKLMGASIRKIVPGSPGCVLHPQLETVSRVLDQGHQRLHSHPRKASRIMAWCEVQKGM
ncbi:hypothetical protein OF83DRAFT_1242401 [Amylostereum chailletii]|nr:hypothetical protein OF83DRAFT_1242401 [Amylostereum chailletii]